MGTSVKVTLSNDTIKAMKSRTNPGENISFSREINGEFSRYSHILKSVIPDLNELEWSILEKIYQDINIDHSKFPIKISHYILEYYNVISIEDLDSDIKKVTEKLHHMAQPSQLVIIELLKIHSCQKQKTENLYSSLNMLKELL